MKVTNKGLRALTTSKERQEIRAVGSRPIVTLKRTYNQKWPDGHVTKFWRVTGPATHRNINSDLSIQGLIEWEII